MPYLSQNRYFSEIQLFTAHSLQDLTFPAARRPTRNWVYPFKFRMVRGDIFRNFAIGRGKRLK